MRAAAVALLLVAIGASCKDTPKPPTGAPATPPRPAPGDAGPPAPPTDWAACDAAISAAATAPLAARPAIVIAGCKVCGDWDPILRWNLTTAEGGPKRPEIEAAMERCSAYCLGDARMKFLGTLDDARGTSSRMPWKQLALLCKERVSAVPDARFVDGAYFALDRIARAIEAHGGDLMIRASGLALPLPAVSIVGVGAPLPVLATGVSPVVHDLQITVLGTTVTVGTMPRAHLTGHVRVSLGSDGYPGKTVTPKDLAAALTALGATKTTPVTLLAPSAMLAGNLVPIIAAAAPVAAVYLGAHAPESPPGWDLPGTVPIMLEAGGANAVRVTATMTVQQLADELARRVAGTANRVGITGP